MKLLYPNVKMIASIVETTQTRGSQFPQTTILRSIEKLEIGQKAFGWILEQVTARKPPDTDGFAACHLAWAAWAKEHNATALKMILNKLGNWTQSSMFDPRQKQRTFAFNFKQLLHSCHWKINIIRRTRVGRTQTGHLRNVSLCHVRCAWNKKQFELSAMHPKAACLLNGFAGRGLGPV